VIWFWLARTDCFPWQAVAFCNDACERALLKRVGGTYRFCDFLDNEAVLAKQLVAAF
jgi:hypothetical protein